MNDEFVVVRVGVYDQGVVAVTNDLGEAKSAAEMSADDEHDNYHSFDVRTFDPEFGEFSETIWTFGTTDYKKPRVWTEHDE